MLYDRTGDGVLELRRLALERGFRYQRLKDSILVHISGPFHNPVTYRRRRAYDDGRVPGFTSGVLIAVNELKGRVACLWICKILLRNGTCSSRYD